ncbi:MAG: hypothetical protein L7U47_06775 [Alphaproteobacteria bacterium]|nr:hypothetical protein [Alphaproteobacteria bacterium]
MKRPFTHLSNVHVIILLACIRATFLPLIIILLVAKYLKYGIALLTPADWSEEEETFLRKAYWKGQREEDLKFILWRRPRDIYAKAQELGLVEPRHRK